MDYITNNIEEIVNLIFFGGISLFGLIKILIIEFKKKRYMRLQGVVISSKKTYFGLFTRKAAHNKYQYNYDGNEYYVEDNFYGGNPRLNVGDTIDIYMSKDDCQKVLKPEELYLKKYYLIIFIGCILEMYFYFR